MPGLRYGSTSLPCNGDDDSTGLIQRARCGSVSTAGGFGRAFTQA